MGVEAERAGNSHSNGNPRGPTVAATTIHPCTERPRRRAMPADRCIDGMVTRMATAVNIGMSPFT